MVNADFISYLILFKFLCFSQFGFKYICFLQFLSILFKFSSSFVLFSKVMYFQVTGTSIGNLVPRLEKFSRSQHWELRNKY